MGNVPCTGQRLKRLLNHDHVGIHDSLRNDLIEVRPRGTADEMPTVHVGILPCPTNRLLVLSINSNDQRSKIYHRIGTALAHMAVDVVHTSTAEYLGTVSESSALIAIRRDTYSHVPSERAIFAAAQFCGRWPNSSLAENFVCKDGENSVWCTQGFERA